MPPHSPTAFALRLGSTAKVVSSCCRAPAAAVEICATRFFSGTPRIARSAARPCARPRPCPARVATGRYQLGFVLVRHGRMILTIGLVFLFAAAFARAGLAALFAATAPALLSALVLLVHRCPGAAFRFLLFGAAFFVALLDVLGFPL